MLDFDGPICSIFSSYTSVEVSSELRAVLAASAAHLPDSVVNEWDPLEILRWAATLNSPALTRRVEDALRAAELRAVSTAAPTPGADDVLAVAKDSGRRVAIVSNNSAPAIEEYLNAHELSMYATHIVGREPYAPEKMKPNPYPVTSAVRALGAKPGMCILIGDSLSDITAAHAAGVPVIGYANKPLKNEQFTEAGADEVVTTMTQVAARLVIV